MEKTSAQLEAENERLRNALVDIKLHMEAVEKIFGDISDLFEEREEGAVTDEDVRNLLKKYSAL
ncbi:MAG: hypothetical protein K6F88_01720 [Ruminococcus sp.]|nr:hypothetical protein [Ruminococcus sp.]